MRQMRELIVVCFLMLLSGLSSNASAQFPFDLSDNWEFRKQGDSTWKPAVVPGSVHLDLMSNGMIADPFIGDNERGAQWIDTCSWEYRCVFNAPDDLLRRQRIELVFEGLDTYADVFFNGEMVLLADNMFRSWKLDCKKMLRIGSNELKVVFYPAEKRSEERARKHPYMLPGGNRVFVRKAAYQFGWDWGPKLVGCGIWKPVRINGWDHFRISNVQVVQKSLKDTTAELLFRLAVESLDSANCLVNIKDSENGSRLKSIQKKLRPGLQVVEVPFRLSHPKRWWTAALGEPYLYKFLIEVTGNRQHSDHVRVSYGLRDLQLIQSGDSAGSSFYFKLNGVPLFAKGANVIPSDHFLTRIDSLDEDLLIKDAVSANMNMLRVWGGGVYASDYFYDLCDRYGILVWQDFMFACSTAPADSQFVSSLNEEVVQQVRRLRNHPSLALWCGNNESEEGWFNWGWQKELKYSVSDSIAAWKEYSRIFHDLIPSVLHKEDPSHPYWPSSPSYGWGRKESLLKGDCHYWGVWWGNEPFEKYAEKVGRFMSEYGFQGYPPMATIKSMIPDGVMDPASPAWKNHQKHPTGFETINRQMSRYYRPSRNKESQVYLSQLLQAEGVGFAIRQHRMNRPYCMGTLYWQLNDSWPVVSWSSRDYYGRWKALHYFVRKLFATMLIVPKETERKIDVYVVSDSLQDYLARMELRVIDMKGNVRWSEIVAADVKANASTMVCSRDLSRIVQPSDTANVLLNIRIYKDGQVAAEANHYFCKPMNLQLTRPAYTVRGLPALNGLRRIELKSSVVARNVELSWKDDTSVFSDNYFDILPDEPVEVWILDPSFPENGVGAIHYRSLVDSY